MRTYQSKTYKYAVGCGELRVRIAIKADGNFHFLLANLDNHDNQCGNCWLEVISNGLTALLRHVKQEEIPQLVKNLKGQRCQYGLQNCPNSLAQAITETFKKKEP